MRILVPLRTTSTAARVEAALLHLCLVALLSTFGCEGTPNPRDLDAEQKAKLVTKLQKEAQKCLDDFQRKAGDVNGVDVADLLCYRDRMREITEVMGPSEYPNGYANYADALTRVGLYYDTLVQALQNELEKAPPAEAPALKVRIQKNREEALRHFRMSNNQLSIYLQNQTGPIDPRAYQGALGNCVKLEDWQGAKENLMNLIASGSLTEASKAEAKELLKEYEERRRRKDEEELERELGREKDRTPPVPAN